MPTEKTDKEIVELKKAREEALKAKKINIFKPLLGSMDIETIQEKSNNPNKERISLLISDIYNSYHDNNDLGLLPHETSLNLKVKKPLEIVPKVITHKYLTLEESHDLFTGYPLHEFGSN